MSNVEVTELPNPTANADWDWLDVTLRMKSGDSEAFAVFYEQNFDAMFRVVQKTIGRDEATILDIVQEAMLKAIRCIKPLPDSNAVSAWSRTVAKSCAYDWLRRNLRDKQVRESTSEPNEDFSSVDDFDDDLVRLEWIEQQLKALPTELRNLISFRYRLGWSLKQIGAKLGLKTGAVDGRIRRAVEVLKEKAKREFNE